MNIYLLEQSINTDYDTFDSCIVYAESEDEAREIHPYDYDNDGSAWDSHTWVKLHEKNHIHVILIGKAINDEEKGIIISSFNAG